MHSKPAKFRIQQTSNDDNLYFQKQGRFSLQCGRHSINNFLGRPRFTKEAIDNICQKLQQSTGLRHRSIVGGDYDINVLAGALEEQGYECQWIDNRKGFVRNDNDQGYLVNVSYTWLCSWMLFWASHRHWLIIKKASSKYALMDSKHDQPVFQGNNGLNMTVNRMIQQQDARVLRIVKK